MRSPRSRWPRRGSARSNDSLRMCIAGFRKPLKAAQHPSVIAASASIFDEHAPTNSASFIVVKSTEIPVVLKFMKDPRTFAEVEARTLDLDPSAVMPSWRPTRKTSSAPRRPPRRPALRCFPCMVALPFADRNLEQIYQSERLAFAPRVLLREIVENVAKIREDLAQRHRPKVRLRSLT